MKKVLKAAAVVMLCAGLPIYAEADSDCRPAAIQTVQNTGTGIVADPGSNLGTGMGFDQGTAAQTGGMEKHPSAVMPNGFLTPEDIPASIHFVPIKTSQQQKEPPAVAEIYKDTSQGMMTGILVHFETEKLPAGAPKNMDTLFSQEGEPAQQMLLKKYNADIGLALPTFNQMIRTAVVKINEAKNLNIPPDLFSVSVRDLEPIRRMEGTDRVIYTAGGRIFGSLDGLIVPQYIRAYLFRNGEKYRCIVLLSGDDDRRVMASVADRIVLSLKS